MLTPLGVNGGEVYLGVHVATGVRVVLKVWLPAGNPQYSQREAVAARLRHPNVLTVVEVGTVPRGPFSVFEWLPVQRTLREWLHDESISASAAGSVVEQVVRAVHYARSQRVRLVRLTTSDVLVTENQVVKVLPVFVEDPSPQSSLQSDLELIGALIGALVAKRPSSGPWHGLREIGLRCAAGSSEPLSSTEVVLQRIARAFTGDA